MNSVKASCHLSSTFLTPTTHQAPYCSRNLTRTLWFLHELHLLDQIRAPLHSLFPEQGMGLLRLMEISLSARPPWPPKMVIPPGSGGGFGPS